MERSGKGALHGNLRCQAQPATGESLEALLMETGGGGGGGGEPPCAAAPAGPADENLRACRREGELDGSFGPQHSSLAHLPYSRLAFFVYCLSPG